MTTKEGLLSVTGYPIPYRALEGIAAKRGLTLTDAAEPSSPSYRLALADLYMWLFAAPNVAQGGQSYSFTDEQRRWWKSLALRIYEELEPDTAKGLLGNYGYMGSRF